MRRVVVGASVVVVVGASVVVVVGACVVVVGASVVVVVGACVVVVGASVVVVVGAAVVLDGPPGSGSVIVANAWSGVTCEMLVATRIWQFLKSGRPLFGEAWFGDRQLNWPDGLAPLNGKKPTDGSPAGKVAVPFTSASTMPVAVPWSQCAVTDHDAEVGSVPSHCSTDTASASPKSWATIVNDCGWPAASPKTWNGDEPGSAMVPANATPAVASEPTSTSTKTKRRRRTPAA